MNSMLIGSPLLKIMMKLAERIPILLKHTMVRPRMISAARLLAPARLTPSRTPMTR